MRPAPVVLVLLLALPAAAVERLLPATHNLRFTHFAPEAVEPDQPATWRVRIDNVSHTDLPEAPLFVTHTGRLVSIQPDLGCKYEFGNATCTLPALGVGRSMTIEIVTKLPFRFGRAGLHVGASYLLGYPEGSSSTTVFWKDFPVTTTADSGPGSLRQAILDINAAPECQPSLPDTPCRAAFRIGEPVPASGWYTLRPLTPLPALTGWDTAVDGTTQSAPNTPAVELDGSQLSFGSGLSAVSRGYFEVRGLSIGGFPWDGIHSNVEFFLTVRDCYVGVDPTGQRANPNGSRGIVSEVTWAIIENNVVSGNRRSGIFFPGGRGLGPNIRNNRIGVAAHDDTPIGNGASGIFVGSFGQYYFYPAAEGNVIANNAHFGVALTANAPLLVLANTIRDNGQGGIDIGLDGTTESVKGVPGVEGGVVPPPVILSARYENGVTIIKGYSTAGNNRRVALLYANSKLEPDGTAEGEQYLGMTPMTVREETAFSFVYPGDLRGKFINGTSYAASSWGWDETSYVTSEFGRAIPVE